MDRREFARKVRAGVKESGLPKEDVEKTVAAFILDKYTLENIVLGYIAPGERVPLDKYICDMGIDSNTYILRQKLSGKYITASGNVADVSVEDCVRTFLKESVRDFADSGRYVDRLAAVFRKVVAMPEKKDERFGLWFREDQKKNLHNLLMGIKNGKITEKSQVRGYITRIDNHPFDDVLMSPVTYKLQVSDMYSLELELSVLMLIDFMNRNNERIFLNKIERFYNYYTGNKKA